jgi:hypothetical protein
MWGAGRMKRGARSGQSVILPVCRMQRRSMAGHAWGMFRVGRALSGNTLRPAFVRPENQLGRRKAPASRASNPPALRKRCCVLPCRTPKPYATCKAPDADCRARGDARRPRAAYFFSSSPPSGAPCAGAAAPGVTGLNGKLLNMFFAWFCICSCICTNMFFDCSM